MTLDLPAEATPEAEGPDRPELQQVLEALGTVLRGRPEPLRLALACVLAGGHLLLEDVPGTGKTTLARALARVLGLDFGRVQFTADLLPTDLTGLGLPGADGEFRFRPGPIFAQVVLADELNRTPPRTQAALLEAMAEGAVTVDGVRHPLPEPFFVLATQNPAEFEGTYPLPESQLDRFLVRVRIGYPPREAEREMLRTHRAGPPLAALGPLLDGPRLLDLRRAVAEVRVDARVEDDVLAIVEHTRRSPAFALGASPRAALDLERFARALALLDGRDWCTPDDVRAAALHVLPHRLVPAERVHRDPGDLDPVQALVAAELEEVGLDD